MRLLKNIKAPFVGITLFFCIYGADILINHSALASEVAVIREILSQGNERKRNTVTMTLMVEKP